MDELFYCYKHLLEERLSTKPLLLISEDCIRYDFFAALMQVYRFKPCQIQLEAPINNQTFIPANEKISFRKEKPLIDLVVDERELKISAEFGLFRQNSNEYGSIDKTARLVKMLNDMIRVSLQSFFTKTTGLFICVADNKMLGHQIRSRIVNSFPSDYNITREVIFHQLNQKTNKFDKRFLNVFLPLNKSISSKIILDEALKASNVTKDTRLIIWEVKLN